MKKHMRKPGTFKTGSFQEFKEFTLAVVRGKRRVDPREPKIWVESAPEQRAARVQFQSLEAGAKLLSPKNRALLRLIAGLVRLDKGAGRAYQPVVTARRVHFEIDLLG
jgi:hypothetical protein